jgi:hypothetical protein
VSSQSVDGCGGEAGLSHSGQPDQESRHGGSYRQTEEPTHGTPPLKKLRSGHRIHFVGQSAAVAVMPACAATGSQTKNPVIAAVTTKRISLRMTLSSPDFSSRDTLNS